MGSFPLKRNRLTVVLSDLFVNNNPYNLYDYLGLMDFFTDDFGAGGGPRRSVNYSGFQETADGIPFRFENKGSSSVSFSFFSRGNFGGDFLGTLGDVGYAGLNYVGDGAVSIFETFSGGYLYPGSRERFGRATNSIIGETLNTYSQLSYDAQGALHGLSFGDFSGVGQMANNFFDYENGDPAGETTAKLSLAVIPLEIKALDNIPSRRLDDGVGLYRDVGGHHIHAKAAFKQNASYSLRDGWSISQQYMKDRGWNHQAMKNYQRKAYKEMRDGKRPNTIQEHNRIAIEALEASGASRVEAVQLTTESLGNLYQQNAKTPTDIPWNKRN